MSSPDPRRDLRNAFGTFATGVTVVTTVDSDGNPRGFTANSFSSVSLEPPLVSVCIARSAGSFPVFASCRSFAVNVLSEHQQGVSNAFASRNGKRFDAVEWRSGETESPLIGGAVAHFDCAMHETVEAGDHAILIGRVVGYDYSAANPLGYCRGAYVDFGLTSEAVAAATGSARTRIGAIVEYDGGLYLPATGRGPLPPTAERLGAKDDAGSLLGRLAGRGVMAELAFVFAVFEDGATGEQNIYYRGQTRAVGSQAAGDFIPLDKLDPSAIRDGAVRSMIERYLRERSLDAFGVYVGDVHTGAVSRLAQA